MNYYNEWDKPTALWLEELIRQGLIPKGDVDTRSITEVKAHEVKHYTQRHWFAGIGGWAFALKLAGWPENEPIDTGSCPCQPISSAGKGAGHTDERHLWPEFHGLIRELAPSTVIGEQVANEDGLEWIDGVSLDLEELGYDVASADLPAASGGLHHKRQRFFFFANSDRSGRKGFRLRAKPAGEARQGGPYSKMALLAHDPFGRGPGWPAPLVRVLDDGLPGDVELLRGYGNAICPEVGAAFIQAAEEARADLNGLGVRDHVVTEILDLDLP